MQVRYPQLATVATPQEGGKWSMLLEFLLESITTEENDLKQQTAPHNHAVDVVDTPSASNLQ